MPVRHNLQGNKALGTESQVFAVTGLKFENFLSQFPESMMPDSWITFRVIVENCCFAFCVFLAKLQATEGQEMYLLHFGTCNPRHIQRKCTINVNGTERNYSRSLN